MLNESKIFLDSSKSSDIIVLIKNEFLENKKKFDNNKNNKKVKI